MSAVARIFRHLRAYRRDEDGTASVEAVLWLPLFGLISGLLVDVTVVFHGQAEVYRVVQDANRSVSVGFLDDAAEAKTFINDRLRTLGVKPKTIETYVDPNQDFIATRVVVPASSLQLIGYFSSLMELDLEFQAVHLLDTWDPATFGTSSLSTVY